MPSGTDLSTETVVEIVEDADNYRGFEAAIIAALGPRSSGNWRFAWHRCYGDYAAPPLLRLNCSGSKQRSCESVDQAVWRSGVEIGNRQFYGTHIPPSTEDQTDGDSWLGGHSASRLTPQPINPARDLAHCFLRLANLDNGVFERLGRYESALARQVVRVKSARVS
jgi:hypothetical protein